MPTPASAPNDTWASFVDDAISDIVKVYTATDPAWDWSYSPDEGYAALAIACGWKSCPPATAAKAQMLHRKAQQNKPRRPGQRGREGYRPRWLQYFNQATGQWKITAYRGVSGAIHRTGKRNAATVLNACFKDVVKRFQSDLLHEIAPAIDEFPAVAVHIERCVANDVLPRLLLIGKSIELNMQSIAPLLTQAERRGVKIDMAACSTMDDLNGAILDALIATGWDDLEEVLNGETS